MLFVRTKTRLERNRGAASAAAFLMMFIAIALAAIPGTVIADNTDPKPPQITVSFLYPPSPLIQHGSAHLVYEMMLTNWAPLNYTVESLEVAGGDKTFRYAGERLKDQMRILGLSRDTAERQQLEAGQSAVIYLTLDFGPGRKVPRELNHTLHILTPDGSDHALPAAPLVVNQRQPVIIGAPLTGPDWIAGDSSHNGSDAAHRRTILIVGGKPWLAQRYAIDWVKYRMVDGLATTWSGQENENSSYFCFGLPIHSVAAGKVIEVLDNVPENVPHSGKYAVDINFISAGGNHVVVDIGGGFYAFYAHMQPGSVTVKVGDEVKAGQLLGKIGNTGSSTEPHLHMHIVDRPSFLAGQGVPYAFANFKASGRTQLVQKPHDAWFFKNIGPLKPFHDDYPAENAAVEFPQE